ncbi:GAF domain-containing protein [uncultured Holdemanella sp.]|uniref:GAF domain-containing protein n=1 Tax=uncultured Holdemanella sp. TaxID=1763549 RepID=UPI0025E2056C|nr:GAF domain-containing protein [uncultured Holdemanella sp.]
MNEILIEQCNLLIDKTLPNIANISNLIALLYHEMKNINWLGFYICDEKNQECTLGPFQGKVACTRISYGKGVVGTCAKTQETQRIEDVHKFPGHIACDCTSNSEICIPIKKDDKLVAILDIDSFEFNNFSKEDLESLEKISELFSPLF